MKISPRENKSDILWNTDISLVDLLHTIHAEEWHTEAIDIARFVITRINHQETHAIPVPENLTTTRVPNNITTLSDLRNVMLHSDGDLSSLPRLDPVEFSEDVAGTSIYWASESIPDVQDNYPNRIRIKLPLPLDDQAIYLLDWYYSNFAPSAIRQEYERGGDPVQQIVSEILEYQA